MALTPVQGVLQPVQAASLAASPLAEMLPHGPIRIESVSVLRTARLVLRPLREADRSTWIELVRSSREDLDQFAPLHEPGESDEALFDRQLKLTNEGEAHGRSWRRVIMLEDGRIAGAVNINAITRGLASEGDMNWWLGTAFQGDGLATEAVGSAVDYAFLGMPAGLGLHKLTASIKPGHSKSERLASRVGFEQSRSGAVDQMRCAGGQWSSHDLYRILPV